MAIKTWLPWSLVVLFCLLLSNLFSMPIILDCINFVMFNGYGSLACVRLSPYLKGYLKQSICSTATCIIYFVLFTSCAIGQSEHHLQKPSHTVSQVTFYNVASISSHSNLTRGAIQCVKPKPNNTHRHPACFLWHNACNSLYLKKKTWPVLKPFPIQ